MKCEICCNYLPKMSVLKAIRSSYFKYFFIHLPLLCLVFKRTTKVEADVIHREALLRDRYRRAVAGAAPGPGSLRSALFGRIAGLGAGARAPPAPRRQRRHCLRSAPRGSVLPPVRAPRSCLPSCPPLLPPAPGSPLLTAAAGGKLRLQVVFRPS